MEAATGWVTFWKEGAGMQAPPPQYECSGDPGEVLAEKWTVRSMYFVFSCCVQGPTGPAEGDGGSDSDPARVGKGALPDRDPTVLQQGPLSSCPAPQPSCACLSPLSPPTLPLLRRQRSLERESPIQGVTVARRSGVAGWVRSVAPESCSGRHNLSLVPKDSFHLCKSFRDKAR